MHVITNEGNVKFVSTEEHALLDGDLHSDTVAQTVSRGSLIYGNSTPKWDELPKGTTGQVLGCDGTDAYWVGGVQFLGTASASASSTIDWVLTPGYFAYVWEFSHVIPSSDGASFYLRTSTDGGSSFAAGGSDYGYLVSAALGSASTSIGTAFATFIFLATIGSAAGESCSGRVILRNPSAASRAWVRIETDYINASSVWHSLYGFGFRDASADVDAVRFLMSTGNISSGTFKLYGIASS